MLCYAVGTSNGLPLKVGVLSTLGIASFAFSLLFLICQIHPRVREASRTSLETRHAQSPTVADGAYALASLTESKSE